MRTCPLDAEEKSRHGFRSILAAHEVIRAAESRTENLRSNKKACSGTVATMADPTWANDNNENTDRILPQTP